MGASRKERDALADCHRSEDFGETEFADERLSIIWAILASLALWAPVYAIYEFVR